MHAYRRYGPIITTLAVGALAACGSAAGPGPAAPEPEDVAVGYGTTPADDVTGAIQSVDTERAALCSNTLLEMLEGRVAGLEVIRGPGGQVQLRLRGTTSITGDTNPLIVIDGVPVLPGHIESALSLVMPQDVAHIDVLKDAGSTAIYGSRGANGVIIIRTKKR